MSIWDCCRMCLGTASLSPIFLQTEHCEHYTNVIFIATGVKVELNDPLPQEACNACITFINETIKFRKNCELTQTTLQSRLQSNTYNVKLETNRTENISIDISDYIDDDFKDYDDNITLNTLQYTEEKILDTKVEINEGTDGTKNLQYKVNKTNLRKKVQVRNKSEGLEKLKEIKRRTKKKEINGEKEKEEIECEYCHKILTSKLSIRNHYKIHTGFDVVCEHCGKKFITRRLLLMHCRAKHGYEKTDKCSYCDYRASNAEQVKIHERLHTGEKPYVCDQCGAGFHRKSSYLQHVAIHLPEKTVQCTTCPARFKSVTLMRIHAARHRAPRYTFQCALCENSFARRRRLSCARERSVTPGPEDRPRSRPQSVARRQLIMSKATNEEERDVFVEPEPKLWKPPRNVARHVQRIHGLPPEPDTICRRKIA